MTNKSVHLYTKNTWKNEECLKNLKVVYRNPTKHFLIINIGEARANLISKILQIFDGGHIKTPVKVKSSCQKEAEKREE